MSRGDETTVATLHASPERRAPARSSRLPHVPALDGLRGAAVAGVLLFHAGHLTGGYLGVDAFFVLSGFLITTLLLSEVRQSASVALGAFWARRARRLLPALGLVLLGVTLYAAFVARTDELATIRGDAIWTIGYLANWRRVLVQNDYFALFRAPSPLQHTWSLAIEEQFYVGWPLVVVLAARRSGGRAAAKRLLVVSLTLALASVVLAQILFDPIDPSRVYFGTDTRAASIFFGAALASWLVLRGPVRSARARVALEAAAIVGVIGLAFAWSALEGSSRLLYRGGLVACGVAVTVIIAAAAHPQRRVIAHALAFRPLCLLGVISYGAYLWHWPIYVWLDEARTGLTGWSLVGFRIAVTLVVATLSYRYVEQPVRRGAGRAILMRGLVPVGAVVVLVAVLLTTQSPVAARAALRGRGGVLLVGDSTAHTLAPGLVDVGLPTEDISLSGCRLIGGTVRINRREDNCDWPKQWAEAVAKQRPDVVVALIGIRDLYDVRPPGASRFVTPFDALWRHSFETSLERAIRVLTRRGAVVVLPQIPCIGTAGSEAGVDRRKLSDPRRLRAAQQSMQRVARRHPDAVKMPDLNRFLCPGGKYQAALQGVPVVRIDGVHYTAAGADLVARWLLPIIDAAAPPGRLTPVTNRRPSRTTDRLTQRLEGARYSCHADMAERRTVGLEDVVACSKAGRGGQLRVYSNQNALDSFSKLYRAVACSYARKIRQASITYVTKDRWILTGAIAQLPEIATLLGAPPTIANC